MPALAKSAINGLLGKTTSDGPANEPLNADDLTLVVQALAAMVVRQARSSLIEGRMVSGTTRSYGVPVGLTPEDRKAMALVSKTCLTHGLRDHGAEIHDLLWLCTKPFGEWLKVPPVISMGLESTFLIEADSGIPTADAEELASGFTGLTSTLEEQLFIRFMEVLARFPERRANSDYTAIREFVVRHPVVPLEKLRRFDQDVSSQIWMLMQNQFYESVPESWQIGEKVPLCDYCGNAMKQGKAGLVCRTAACNASFPAKVGRHEMAANLLRVTRGIRQYWVEPGFDEIRMYDALIAHKHPAELYPNRDRVDIAVGEIGIDLKSYASPEILGRHFKRGIGGLAHYRHKWVVVPDWLVNSNPTYLDRLKATIERGDLECLSVSHALRKIRTGGVHA